MEIYFLGAQDIDTVQSWSWYLMPGYELAHSLLNGRQQCRQILQLILRHELWIPAGQVTKLLEPTRLYSEKIELAPREIL